ncbi:hypothetical protein ACFSTI_02000 [Rhizorhabdus histidinilytica]
MLHAAIERDWQNDYADFSLRLKGELEAIANPAERRHAIAEMRGVLRSHQRLAGQASHQRHKRRA